MIRSVYKNIITNYSKLTLLVLVLILSTFVYFSKDFKLDASSDTLLLENDPDLKYLREVNNRYGSKDFLVLTYTPKENLLNETTIENLTNLKNDLSNLNWVNNVLTILDVPLLKNNEDSITERIKNFKTLSSENVDKERGFKEIINSPIYKEFVISNDGKTTGILVYIKPDEKITALIKTKNDYLDKKALGKLTVEEKKNYNRFLKEYDIYKKSYNKKNHQNINEIRAVIEKHKDTAKIHLGGIPMIADDMMTYIKNDIVVFGAGVFIFIVCTLWFVFRNLLWVFIPLLSCFFSVFIMVGLLGLVGSLIAVYSVYTDGSNSAEPFRPLFTFAAVATGSLLLGVSLGLISGYFGGRTDTILMRIGEIFLAFPGLLLVILIAATIKPRILEWVRDFEDATGYQGLVRSGIVDYLVVFGALTIFSWVGMARLVRGQVLALKELEYVEAARAMGASSQRIILIHLLPNALPTIIVMTTIGLGATAGAEVVLSWLGIGIQPPVPSLGNMIQEGQNITILRNHPHLLVPPIVVVGLLIFAWNLLGDALNDILNPRSR